MGDTGSIHAISGIQRERDACHVGGAPTAGACERLRALPMSWPNDVETQTERILGEPSSGRSARPPSLGRWVGIVVPRNEGRRFRFEPEVLRRACRILERDRPLGRAEIDLSIGEREFQVAVVMVATRA